MKKRFKNSVLCVLVYFLNDKCVKLNAQNEFECTNYGITKVTKPCRAKLNDQIAKMVTFSWFWMKSVYFRIKKNIGLKASKVN